MIDLKKTPRHERVVRNSGGVIIVRHEDGKCSRFDLNKGNKARVCRFSLTKE